MILYSKTEYKLQIFNDHDYLITPDHTVLHTTNIIIIFKGKLNQNKKLPKFQHKYLECFENTNNLITGAWIKKLTKLENNLIKQQNI